MSDLSGFIDLVYEGSLLPGGYDPTPLFGRLDIHSAHEVQLGVLDRWLATGESLGGWKVGMTSGAMRDSLGPGVRPFGFILAGRVLASDSEIELSRLGRAGCEPELALRIETPLSGDQVDSERARRSVGGILPAFEINQRRLAADSDAGIRIADDLSQWGIVVGEEVALSEDFDPAALHVDFFRDGALLAGRTGTSDLIDDPFDSLAELVRRLSRFGRGLERGQIVLTGAFAKEDVTEAAAFEAEFSALGRVRATFW